MTDLRKEVGEMKEGWKTRTEGLEKRLNTMKKKIKEIKEVITGKIKEKEKGKLARITDLVIE